MLPKKKTLATNHLKYLPKIILLLPEILPALRGKKNQTSQAREFFQRVLRKLYIRKTSTQVENKLVDEVLLSAHSVG